MKRVLERVILVLAVLFCFAAASCYTTGGAYVGYGYSPNYYDDVFYTAPANRYGYGFYGHP